MDAFDIDAELVRAANEHAAAYRVADRVRSHLLDGAHIDRPGGYDLVLAFECIHDMSDPVAVLAEYAGAPRTRRHGDRDGRAGAGRRSPGQGTRWSSCSTGTR